MAEATSFWDLFRGRATVDDELNLHLSAREGASLSAKARQAYYWIVNNVVIVPYYDIAFGGERTRSLAFRDSNQLELPAEPSYASFVLLPLLTFLTRRRALLVGGPGRGKTVTAVLMGLLAGYSRDEMRRAVQHGHPQMTISDLLGVPLPSDMLAAESLESIRVSWRRWLSLSVKVIDEYNRIPTKTQSALLSLMSEGYAELFGQTVEAGDSAWFLTANDDGGGGTFKVIDALKDRIDITIRAMPFNSRFLPRLLERIESGRDPAEEVPVDIQFSAEELQIARDEIRALPFDPDAFRKLEFFVGSLDFCQRAASGFEFKSKDTLRLEGIPLSRVCNEECPLDKMEHVCSQTTYGLSVRSYMTVLEMSKALAWFRGKPQVTLEDVSQILPYCLHEKLEPNVAGAFFQDPDHRVLVSDKITWIREMFAKTNAHFDRVGRRREEQGQAWMRELDAGLEGVDKRTVESRMRGIKVAMDTLAEGELDAGVYEEMVRLKSLYMRYQNYWRWLRTGQEA